MSGGEIFIILLVVLLLFGAESIPSIARQFGKILYQVKNATDEIKHDIRNSAREMGKDIKQSSNIDIESDLKDTTDDFDETLNS